MTEQIEDDFWAAERARAAAEHGRQADPSACGTCRAAVEAGGHAVHDGCAQRATLLPAPDAPGYELITGLTEEELAQLPARFHTPVFLDTARPQSWVCAVCWGEGWVTGWPCKTAVKQGLRVFTPEHEAETAAKRQAAELAAYRALELGDVDGRVSASCDNPDHPTWLRKPDDTRGCPWCRTEEMETYAHGCDAEGCTLPHSSWCERAKKTAAENDGCTCGQPWEGHPQPHAMHCWTVNPPRNEIDEMRKRIAELEADLKRYVGHEPTIAEELAYLSRCLDAVLELCDKAEQQASRWEQPLPVPEWVTPVRAAAEGLTEREKYPPAMPWARLMDDEDLEEFLADLTAAAVHHDGAAAITEIEATCGRWRMLAEAQHAHNTAPGPDAPEGGERR